MRWRLLLVAAAAAVTLAGCGGSASVPPGSGGLPAGVVTRDEEPRFTADGLLLASLSATDAWIPLALATAIDADLVRIRSAYPILARIHARPRSEPKTLLVTLHPAAPFRDAWIAGTLTTGDTGLDALLTQFNATGVRHLTGDLFVITFAQWLNTNRLAGAVKAASTQIRGAGENLTVGDGDQILRSEVDGVRTYAFVQGWGDCPAGCIYRHRWNVSIAPDGTLSVTESGSPLP